MKKQQKFKLHYIGKGLYKINFFEREAKKYGVQRALSFSQLKQLKFGEPILLARFIPEQKVMEIDLKQIPPKLTGKELETIPSQAEIFGFFTVDGISHNLPKERTNQLYDKLNIIKTVDELFSVSRACGSYSVGGVAYIKDSLETLLKKIENMFTVHKDKLIDKALYKDEVVDICICPKCNNESEGCEGHSIEDCVRDNCDCCTFVNYKEINSHKWFINGKYYPLTPFILSPAKFLRGIQTVKIKDLNLNFQRQTNSALVWLYNYRQRHYLPKVMRDKLEHPPKNPFKNAF